MNEKPTTPEIPADAVQAAESAVRAAVRIRLGPNALAQAQRGEPLILSCTEAEQAARAALEAAAPLLAERVRAEERAAIARVRRLHFQYRGPSDFDSCAHCNRGGHEVPWPCDTIKTLNGTHPEPQPPGADELLDLWRAGRRMGGNRA